MHSVRLIQTGSLRLPVFNRLGLQTLALTSLCALLAACGGGSDSTAKASTSGATARAQAAEPSQSVWSPKINLPFVPAAAANLPDGKVVMWSAEERLAFLTGPKGRTYTMVFDPATNTSTERLVAETGHDMFCPGTTNLPDGRLLINGGIDETKTSIYDPATGAWSTAAAMNIPRGYQANTLLGDGTVLTLGGSFSGGLGSKHGELWSEAGGWRRLTGLLVEPMQTKDAAGVFRSDNHMWLIPTGNGQVLHAGPSINMNWIDPRGNGSSRPAGLRSDDVDSMSGITVMYDIGKILKAGGSTSYSGVYAHAGSYVIDTNAGLTVRKIAPMNYARAFHNSVVLPNGQVLIVGGQTYASPLSDNLSVLAPELWDPETEAFTVLPPITVPRNYHSNALLLPDGRVLSAGGGLCGAGCDANHPDAQILTPHYLLNPDGSPATRPVINTSPAQATYGTSFTVVTNAPVTKFALVRLSSTTHTVNNDQRRIPLSFTTTGTNSYSVAVPSNPGIALPGVYMLFALNEDGVPSVAKNLRIVRGGAPTLTSPSDQIGTVGTPVNLALAAGGATSFSAVGLPAGVTISATSGALTGAPTDDGTYRVSVFATNASGTVSSDFAWTVNPAGTAATVRFVRLEEVTEYAGRPWASMAEFNLLDPAGNVLPRTGWIASADSVEATYAAPASYAIDGAAGSIWHTAWSASAPPPPHTFTVNLGAPTTVGGFRYLPRQDGNTAGVIAQFRFYVSNDGVNWGAPVAEGNFSTMGALAAAKTVVFATTAPANRPPVLTSPGAQTSDTDQNVSLALTGVDPDGDALTYSATGLPPGLVIAAGTGLITGAPTTAGTYATSVTLRDAKAASATIAFTWTVRASAPVVQPVLAPPSTAGGAVTYTANATGAGLAYAWDFGDGSAPVNFSTSATTTHAYAAPGLYTVTLQVRGADGSVVTSTFTQAVASAALAGRPGRSSNILFEPRTGANSRVWVVNQDNDSVSVFDAVTNGKVAEIAVGAGPRTLALSSTGSVWVVNKDAASVSVISASTLTVQQTIGLPRASQPFGLVFSPADGAAFVSLQARGQLVKLSVTGGITSTLDVGPQPGHLAITADGSRLLLSRFITPALPGEGTASVLTEVAGAPRGGEVLVVQATPLALTRTTVLRHSDKPDSAVQGRGVPNYLGAAAISPDGRSAWVPSKQDNVKRGTLRDGQALDFQNTVRAISSRIDLATLAEDYAARVDHDNSSVASAAAYHPSGAYLFVTLETSRHVAVVDPVDERELVRFDTGIAPQGLTVSADGLRLYVSNFMDRSVAVYDLSRLINFGESVLPRLATLNAVGTERLSAQVLAGKKLFYDARDPRLSRESYMSCATCHRDGSHDGRTWDLTSLGEGLRNTISMQGRGAGHGRPHWTGNFDEIQDFEAQIRALAGGGGLMTDAAFNTGTRSQPLGDPKAGVSADLDALAAYAASLTGFSASPDRNADGSLTAAALQGRSVFVAQCLSCHGSAAFTDSASNALHNIGTLKPSSGKRLNGPLTGLDTPTLRDVALTAPYLHDGSAPTLADAVRAHTNLALSETEIDQVSAYAQQIGSEEAVPTAPGPTGTVRYVRLEQLTEIEGRAWGSMAEFNLLDAAGNVLPRAGWVASADSSETRYPAPPAAALDGSNASIWHTAWNPASVPPPHQYTVNLGAPTAVAGFRYLPRQDSLTNGNIAEFRFYVSNDGVNWGTPVAQGNFTTMGAVKAAKTVMFGTTAPVNRPPVVTSPGAQASGVGQAVTLAIAGSDPDGDVLTYTAAGLPTGLSIAPGNGVISGTPTAAGTFTTTVTATDTKAAATAVTFAWTVAAAPTSAAVRYVKLEQVTEFAGRPWASMAEFNLLDALGNVLPRTGWRATADSAETVYAAPAAMAIDGSAGTIWHTQWVNASPPPVHSFVVDLGAATVVRGFRYLPRQDGNTAGVIAQFRFYVSNDGVNWGAPVAEGNFSTMGATAAAKTVVLP
jgi:YVTN family beta-propeller protein